jgi:hypothetical protein
MISIGILLNPHCLYFVQICIETQLPRQEVLEQAQAVLDEMAHNLRNGAIRFFAFFLIKTFKKLYQRIYVNEEAVEKVCTACQNYFHLF